MFSDGALTSVMFGVIHMNSRVFALLVCFVCSGDVRAKRANLRKCDGKYVIIA